MNQDIYVLVEHLRGRVADISYTLLAAARVLAAGTEGDVIAALLGEDAQELAGDLAADRVLYVDAPALAEFTPDAYQTVLAGLIQENVPRAVLLGHTSVGMDVAGALSARLELPFVSQCRRVTAEDGNLGFVSTICGGKIMATGELPGPTTLVTLIPGGFKPEEGRAEEPPEVVSVPAPPLGDLHVKLKRYIEPETGDVDISAEPILVAIGRGVQTQDNIELAEELAELLGGVICASRPVVDQGWLPTSRMVGKSGRSVKPKLYLAMGISGAPEHVEGIVGSETIVAVNVDPDAPIFDVAQFGAEADMLDLLEVLIEQVEEAKGG